MFYRSLATSWFLHQTSDFPCRHFLNSGRSRALSTQSLFASHIAQELSGRFTAHSFLRPGPSEVQRSWIRAKFGNECFQKTVFVLFD